MTRLYLVRHGKAAAGFDGHIDPGLDDLGRTQADATARELAPLGPLPILSSPLARARETAEPLARIWGVAPRIEPRVAELPSPTADLTERTRWIRQAMRGTWQDLGPDYLAWRDALVDCVRAIDEPTVIFCHYIAINVLVGHVRRDDRLVIFAPDNGSVTRFRNTAAGLELEALGRTADTHVN